jgi:arsenical resistance protein ArsH
MAISNHPPRILFLYGSLRERSHSRLLAEEAAQIIQEMGTEVKALRIANPKSKMVLPYNQL